ncbi:phosphatidate cytidylyltransferase [Bacillus oleivorans]|uniref:Phosphatidate cytidylyltransferase n=1 Tax=Bacillus oleivorans TaxID=1448271 RepID=A0A285D1R1_9BACI|nr:phosphatidate cytidylyltransferase [Bacillus oleivorans]SNX73744.1 phosphatidate cytidylyltransferase [Bacillus oleivorans]
MKQRIITAIIAGAIFLPIVFYGNELLTIATYILATIGLHELLRMRKQSLRSVPGLLSVFMLWVFLLPAEQTAWLEDTLFSKMELVFLIVLLFLTYTVITKNKVTFDDVSFSILSTLYVGIGFYFLIVTREEGLYFILYSLFIIWTTDSGAYFIGKAYGKRKLWPEISPNKTVEGSIGGVVCAIITAIVFFLVYPAITDNLVIYVIGTIVLSVFGQIGDLVESALKRYYNVKDSGDILPGHGGILDRFDSLLFVLPLLNFILI